MKSLEHNRLKLVGTRCFMGIELFQKEYYTESNYV